MNQAPDGTVPLRVKRSRTVKKASLLCILVLATAQCLHSQPVLFPQPLSPRIASYTIEAKLNAATKILKGHELVHWRNASSDVVNELQFHLYQNAFRNSRSTFIKESGGVSRGFRMGPDGWGFIDIGSISLSGGRDMMPAMEFIHPDDDNAEDRTVFRLPLPAPLSPGDTVVLAIDFTVKVPDPPVARSGSKGEYFFFGQWFPKVGVYIDGAWNCHQYHATSEFFADYGVYNVALTVPRRFVVGATGQEYGRQDNPDTTVTHLYHAEDVHDFSWTTSPDFIEATGKESGVDIRVLLQPDHAGQAERHLNAAKTAIRYFHNWYGLYPYPNLTVVDPKHGAGGSGGMEYPTLITAGTSYGLPEGVRTLEDVIIHEFGHNYWYHLLASNEFEESWMDEGINTYTEIQIMNDAYGPVGDVISFAGLRLNDLQGQRASYISGPDLDPTVRKAWEYYSGSSYGINSYSKPGILLTTLQNYLGKETMRKAMRTYADRWRFKHPKSRDFTAVISEVAGQNLDWFFDQALYTNAVLDYSVDEVTCDEVPAPRGIDYTMAAGVDSSAPVKSPSGDAQKLYKSEVSIRRLGTFHFPVETEMVFSDGEKVREQWDGVGLWKKYTYVKPAQLVSAAVDPDDKIPLDVNRTNNSRTVKPQTLGITRLSLRVMFWTQFLLDEPDVLSVLNFLTSIF